MPGRRLLENYPALYSKTELSALPVTARKPVYACNVPRHTHPFGAPVLPRAARHRRHSRWAAGSSATASARKSGLCQRYNESTSPVTGGDAARSFFNSSLLLRTIPSFLQRAAQLCAHCKQCTGPHRTTVSRTTSAAKQFTVRQSIRLAKAFSFGKKAVRSPPRLPVSEAQQAKKQPRNVGLRPSNALGVVKKKRALSIERVAAAIAVSASLR